MFKFKNNNSIKGIAFSGCSFTWGQSLYYYSNLPTLLEPIPNGYNPYLVTECHRRFMMSRRYPRLVANHFNTFELCLPKNGGSNLGGLSWWDEKLKENINDWRSKEPQNLYERRSEVDTMIIQLTESNRDPYKFSVYRNNKEIRLSHPFAHLSMKERPFNDDKTWPELFLEHLERDNLDYDEVYKNFVKKNLLDVKKYIRKFTSPEYGMKVYILTWPDEFVEYIEEDDYLNKRFIPLFYKGTTYKSIEKMMQEHPELIVGKDYEFFETPPEDNHPSLTCHKVMADSIIKYIEKNDL